MSFEHTIAVLCTGPLVRVAVWSHQPMSAMEAMTPMRGSRFGHVHNGVSAVGNDLNMTLYPAIGPPLLNFVIAPLCLATFGIL
eukprot:4726920-Amphidinium_carterae.1